MALTDHGRSREQLHSSYILTAKGPALAVDRKAPRFCHDNVLIGGSGIDGHVYDTGVGSGAYDCAGDVSGTGPGVVPGARARVVACVGGGVGAALEAPTVPAMVPTMAPARFPASSRGLAQPRRRRHLGHSDHPCRHRRRLWQQDHQPSPRRCRPCGPCRTLSNHTIQAHFLST